MNLSQQLLWATPAAGVLALGYAFLRSRWIGRHDTGTDRMREVSGWIRSGAMAFMGRQYRVLGVCAAAVAVLLAASNWNSSGGHPLIAASFLAGAFCSALAGYVGMHAATAANVRTTQAARQGLVPALSVAFAGGSVMGMSAVGLGILGLGGLTLALTQTQIIGQDLDRVLAVITGFSLGASSIALFARLGGGIYGKAADLGAHLGSEGVAGEPAIPGGDPRNAAVIADNVGDNVSDVAGMGADLFESYVSSIVAAMILAGSVANLPAMVFPLVLAAAGVIVSIGATVFVRAREGGNPQRALSLGTGGAALSMIGASAWLASWLVPDGIHLGDRSYGWLGLFCAVVAGLLAGTALGLMTEYYTARGGKPVGAVAASAETGAATTVLSGLALGMGSTALPVLVIGAAVLAAHAAGGLYGIALAALGMLSTTGIQLAVDAYGPIADNAGDIAEMSGLPRAVRDQTDRLDAAGNTTAAIGKGFAIGSAALTALALLSAYITRAHLTGIDVAKPTILVGLLLGAMLPFSFSALALRAVARAGVEVVAEVRRQLSEIPGLRTGQATADHLRCVDVAAGASLRRMVAPAAVAVLAPVAVGLYDREALAALIVGVTVSGVLLAIFQANAGGAWDHARKHIEDGHHGGRGGQAHQAAVIADTVGDTLKDTSGPALNILIKLMSVVAVVLAPLIA